MTALEGWLKQATRQLSSDSAAKVRREIQEHYESAHEAAMSRGVTPEEADRMAVSALGDARTANCQYRNVLLTAGEARLLRQAKWEGRAVCSRPWLTGLLLALPIVFLIASATLFLEGSLDVSRTLLAAGVGMSILFAAPFLPIYTPARGRLFRYVKWVVMIGILGLAFGPSALKMWWLLMSCLWPMVWIEWTRISIRRKLPVAEWPKQLYL